ncbi:MAG: hypothetical protein ACK5FE_11680 [Cyanobacteriota bacterium]|jgi:hypothetical protein
MASPRFSLYSFQRFPGNGELRLCLDRGDVPAHASVLLAEALDGCERQGIGPEALPLVFLESQEARLLAEAAPWCEGGAGCGQGEYAYQLAWHRARRPWISISCWRRYPAMVGWTRRCGPMRLQVFLERFEPQE